MIYEIKRGTTTIWSGKAKGTQHKTIMQEDRVEIEIKSPTAIAFKKGDTIQAYGQTYKLNRPENISKVNTQVGYTYTIEFEALYYDLGKWNLYTLNKDNQLKEPDVYVMGEASVILGLLVQNANRASSGWALGTIETTEVFEWTYSSAKLLTVLQDVADRTKLEFWVDGKQINLTRRQPVTGITLEYGKGKGLYGLQRSRRSKPIVTHLTVLGGSKNIPNGYGFRNVQPTGGNPMVNPNYQVGDDIVEDTIVFENVYPRLIAAVTSVQDNNVIRSTDIDFDLNDYLLDDGTSAQIAFTSGLLNGFKFTIRENGYDHATKQVTFNIIEDDNAYPGGVPDNVLKPAIGDTFVFLNISMPETYVTNAEDRTKDLGDQYFDEEGVEQYDWSGNITPKFVIENEVEFVLGGLIHLKASDIGFDGNIRIASYTRDLQEEYKYTFTLSNVVSINSLVRQRNMSDRLANTVSKGISADGLSTKATYAERAGYAGTAGHALTATNAATANYAVDADHAYNADHAINADYAIEANHSVNADLATYALDADKWDGQQFVDYLNQPVRTNDSPKFEGVSSPIFVSGAFGSGYRISKSGDKYTLELDNVFVRDGFTATELTINKIRSSNGAIAVTDAGVIKSVQVVDVGQFNITLEGDNVPFLANDILKCQVFTGTVIKSYYLLVLDISSTVISVVKLQGGAISTGDTIVRVGNNSNVNRQGLIYLTNSDSGAPYLDVLDGVDGTSFTGKTKVRLGKLDGIVDPEFGALSGYGIYAERGFFKGSIQVTGGNAATKNYAETQALNAKNEANSYTSTQFNVLDGRINLKADQTTVTGLDARLSSAELKITPEAINITVSSQVDNKIGAVQVGGRNYIRNSNFYHGTSWWGGIGYCTLSMVNGRMRITATSPGEYGIYGYDEGGAGFLLPTGDVVFSGILYSSTGYNLYLYDNYYGNKAYYEDDGKKIVLRFHNGIDTWSYRPYVFATAANAGDYFEIDWLMYETGNKAGDWSPNPKDLTTDIEARPTQDQIKAGISITPGAINIFGQELSLAGKVTFSSLDAGAQNQINVIAQDKVNTLAGTLKAMAFEDVVELSKLGNTVIQGGYLATNLLDANYIKSNIVNAAYIQTIDLVADKITAGKLSSADNSSYFDLDNGEIYTESLHAYGGTVGALEIDSAGLKIGSNDSWEPNSNYLRINSDYLVYRKNGATSGKRREFAFDLYSNSGGGPHTYSVDIKNTIDNTGMFGGANTALRLESANGNNNYAIHVVSGLSNLKSVSHGIVVISGNYTCGHNDQFVLTNGTGTVYLPSSPISGRIITVFKRNSGVVTVNGNGYNIHYRDDGGSSSRTLEWSMTFIFAGDRWQLTSYF